eukprot:747946-Hanusia_phi.AAC.1
MRIKNLDPGLRDRTQRRQEAQEEGAEGSRRACPGRGGGVGRLRKSSRHARSRVSFEGALA